MKTDRQTQNTEKSKKTGEIELLYGSFYAYKYLKKPTILAIIWLLPHDIRRNLFKKLFPKDYWRILEHRRDLENGFNHPENDHLYYSIAKFHEKKSIYVHIPKCGGISIATSLFGHCVPHSTITDYQIMFGSQVFNSYFKFTIARNPWDRLVSAFFFLKSGGFDSTDKKTYTPIIQKYNHFGEFVKSIYFNREYYMRWTHLLPQSLWIKTPSGKMPLDYIGKLENLSQDLKYICDRIGISYPKIKKQNTSQRGTDYRDYYTPETKSMVEELYKEDIELLGYEF